MLKNTPGNSMITSVDVRKTQLEKGPVGKQSGKFHMNAESAVCT